MQSLRNQVTDFISNFIKQQEYLTQMLLD